ncbi:MAG: hypothetical protein O9262_02445 [Cyclobacteriaceae bacterium]|nr:hypothetical protein [Cyclobacteriaceae bacterium]
MRKKTDFVINKINELTIKYGEVPPYWVYKPNSHPYSIFWRQGGGEEFADCFVIWFEENCRTLEDKIIYFKKYSPPPRWLATVVEFLWEVEGWTDPTFDYTPYFRQLEEFGFNGISDYQKDLDDEKWLDFN